MIIVWHFSSQQETHTRLTVTSDAGHETLKVSLGNVNLRLSLGTR